VAIVVNTYNQSRFLADALESCLRQTTPASEILVIDDGSDDDPASIAAQFAKVSSFYRQPNSGRSAAKNAGLARVTSEFIIFLDADDRLTPAAVAAGLECFANDPDAWLVYGKHHLIDALGRIISGPLGTPAAEAPFLQLLRHGNLIAMHGAVMYRAERLRSISGFDEALHACEDYDVYLRIAQAGQLADHNYCVAEYRQHSQNTSRDKELMLDAARSVVRKAAYGNSADVVAAAYIGEAHFIRHYAPQIISSGLKNLLRNGWDRHYVKQIAHGVSLAPVEATKMIARRGLRRLVRKLPNSLGRMFGEDFWEPKLGKVRFGDFARTKPIAIDYGYHRGKPVDRYYIEKAISAHSENVRGHVLEVCDPDYTIAFGAHRVTQSDVLDIDPQNPKATIIGDLGTVGSLPEGTFDCIILTQTLQFIRRPDNAIENLYRALSPGGCLLITAPGISLLGSGEIKYWYWTFTELSLRTLLSDRFGEDSVEVNARGNVYAAISFLTGLTLADIETDKLEYNDPSYPVTVFGFARKIVAPQ
jgi:glycosyltransferase involved in cell wall biosynthesis